MFWKSLIDTLNTAEPGTVRAKAVLAWKVGHAMLRVAKVEWDRVDELCVTDDIEFSIEYGKEKECEIRHAIIIFWTVLETYQEITSDEDARFELQYASAQFLFNKIVEEVLGEENDLDALSPWERAVEAARKGDTQVIEKALKRAEAWEKAAKRLIEAARRHQNGAWL